MFVLAAGVWPASAEIITVKVNSPANGSVISGTYTASGTPNNNFAVPNITGTAKTDCAGWASIRFAITGPAGYNQNFNLGAKPKDWTGGTGSPWDTRLLPNGDYVVRLDATEDCTVGTDRSTSAQSAVKVANPAPPVVWESDPTATGDEAPVRISFRKVTIVDVKEYRIVRTGPDGTRTAIVPPNGCPLSGNVYTCVDDDFDGEYTGTYEYAIFAVRSAPTGTGQPCSATSSARCVSSASSEVKPVSLTAPPPPPTPTPSPSPTGDPSTDPSPTAGPTGGKTNTPAPPRVLSFGGGSGSSSEFYTGTYSTTLPYEATKSLLVPSGSRPAGSPQASGYDGEVTSQTAPNFRTVMLPVAGGLLAFLSAAHVRRLLTNI